MPSRQSSPSISRTIDLTGVNTTAADTVDRLRRRLAEAQKTAARARKDHEHNKLKMQQALVDFEAVEEAQKVIQRLIDVNPTLSLRLYKTLERLRANERAADETWRASASTLHKAKKAVAAAKSELAAEIDAPPTPANSPQ